MANRRPYPGLFVVLEGADGTGKTLLGKQLESSLDEAGLRVVMTREPGGTPFAETIREIILSPSLPNDSMVQMLLFNAARRDHIERRVIPLLEDGYVVICDRYLLSTMAYQSHDLGYDTVVGLHKTVVGLVPDLMFLVDADVEVIFDRINVRSKDEPGGITEWTEPEAILKRKHLYYRALDEMKAQLGSNAYLGGEGWVKIMNNLPVHVAEGEALVHILRAITDLIPSRRADHNAKAREPGSDREVSEV
jgi:dTMP kinase